MKTYGRVKWSQGRWHIRCEPHVMLRAKRVFAQVAKRQQGEIVLHDTPGTARDIEWFLERYPMEVEDAKRLDQRAREHDQAMAAVQRVLQSAGEPAPFDLAIPARRYQRSAAELVLATGRLLLGDDLGLGKTASAICVLSDPRARPAVVVTLTALPGQWREQVRKFAPSLNVLIPKKGTPQRHEVELLQGLIRPDVVILNYAKLAGWAETLAQVFQPKTVVFDEVQELRTGSGSAKYAAAEHLAQGAAYRMGLSATPIYNYGGEIYAVLAPLAPGELGSWGEFGQEWCAYGASDTKAKIKDPKAFGAFLRERGLFLRRTCSDVRDEVPELADPIRIPHVVDADTSVLAKAETAAAELARIILSTSATNAERFEAAGEIDWRLRQATGIAKAPYVAAFVRMLLQADDQARVLLYGWHHAVYELWGEALKDYRPVFFTGQESTLQKEASKAAFLDGSSAGSRVLIMSLRAGAGLDGLQDKCRLVVFGELDWSPGVHEQCLGRVHRPGQKDTVRAYFLHSESGSDPVMVEVLGLKKAQVQGIRDPDADLVEKLQNSGDHIRRLAEACLARAGGSSIPQESVA